MADRDRYDWERGRDFDRDRFGEPGGERGRHERGMMSRGTDEVRSWFGDDEARRRREMDEQRDAWQRDRGERDFYGANSERARQEHGWRDRGERPDSRWESGRSHYGDQRDFVGRSSDWRGNAPSNDGEAYWAGGARDYGDEDARRRYRGYGPGAPGAYGRGSGSTTGEGRWGAERFNENPAYPNPFRDSSQGWSGSGYQDQAGGRGTFSGRGPRNYQRSDERVREDVNERLTIDWRIDASDIDVRVQNGEVTLTGTVDDRRTRRLAEEIIEDLPGVRDVRNDLKVQGRGDERHRQVGEQSRQREDGSIGSSGDPQRRDDVTTVNVKEGGRK